MDQVSDESPARFVRGVALGVVLAGGAVALLVPLRAHLGSATPALVLTVVVGASAVAGGRRAVALVSVAAGLALDLVFIPPYGTLDVLSTEDTATLVSFLVVSTMGGWLVAAQSDRRREAELRERELRRLTEQLQTLDRERAVLSDRAVRADDLARIDSQRSALLRSVSHDLRTPLSAIRAIVTDLRDETLYDEATRAELLTVVSDEVERLDRLVANLLSMSRIEAHALMPDRQAIDLHELVADRLRQLAPLFREVRVRTDLPEELPLVDGDYPQLEQVLTNLFANLSRHAPAGTDVWVVARARNDDVLVEISDRGAGVADQDRERIFEPFQRGDGSGSSGIGLAICKAIVEGHGGTIHVERTFGGGATFAFTLPVHRGRVPT